MKKIKCDAAIDDYLKITARNWDNFITSLIKEHDSFCKIELESIEKIEKIRKQLKKVKLKLLKQRGVNFKEKQK